MSMSINQYCFFALLAGPLVVGILAACLKTPKASGVAGTLGSLVYGGAWSVLAVEVIHSGSVAAGPFSVDGLSAFMALLISAIGVLASVFSIGYMNREEEHGNAGRGQIRLYYFLYHAFMASMYLVVCVDNLGQMWVAIEATTLISAVLVGLYGKRHSLEAAWKYLILCGLGIALALFGTVLLYHAAKVAGAGESGALSWTGLRDMAGKLDPKTVRLAFIFMLVGYGTKAGLAPMHTWLPDAHSQAPSPVSAVLSGVLLNCALYGLLRTGAITAAAVGSPFVGSLFIGFGLLSLATATPFLMVQKDLKRLLAYSSVEHMGIITLGAGFGFYTKAGSAGAFLHMFNHAFGKTLLFFVAGLLIQGYGTKRIQRLRGILAQNPVMGLVFFIGLMAITGMPPFGLFNSEMAIALQGFHSKLYPAASVLLIALALAFGAFAYHGGSMLFGSRSGRLPERLSRADGSGSGALYYTTLLSLAAPVLVLVYLGLHVPDFVRSAIEAAMSSITLK